MCLARPGSPIHELLKTKNIYNSAGFSVDPVKIDSILESILQKKTEVSGQKLANKLGDMFTH